eukprot:scaffold9430_cov134-Skeletonema_menzelii.AAC.1
MQLIDKHECTAVNFSTVPLYESLAPGWSLVWGSYLKGGGVLFKDVMQNYETSTRLISDPYCTTSKPRVDKT